VDPQFLTLDEVLALHGDQIRRYGGRPRLRDVTLLSSAIAMPAATYRGEYLHQGLHEMAAAYLFHICRNRPFVDGNKRASLAATLTFLRLNGLRVRATEDELTGRVIGVAAGRIGKPEVAVFLKHHARRRR
jgi:death-on-curing protein